MANPMAMAMAMMMGGDDECYAQAATNAGGAPLPDPLAGRLHRLKDQLGRQGRRSGVPLHQLWGGGW